MSYVYQYQKVPFTVVLPSAIQLLNAFKYTSGHVNDISDGDTLIGVTDIDFETILMSAMNSDGYFQSPGVRSGDIKMRI